MVEWTSASSGSTHALLPYGFNPRLALRCRKIIRENDGKPLFLILIYAIPTHFVVVVVSQECTVKKTWTNALPTPATMVARARTCLGIILATAPLIRGLEHSTEGGTVLMFSWAVPIPRV